MSKFSKLPQAIKDKNEAQNLIEQLKPFFEAEHIQKIGQNLIKMFAKDNHGM